MKKQEKIKIALLGTRGIPATHGGFETCVEEIGQRLVKKGHEVSVYSKKNDLNKSINRYMGMKIIRIPRVKIKGFETLFSTILSVIHSLFHSFDIHMVFNVANSPALIFYNLFKKKYSLNTDGLEWKREKWGFVGRNYFKVCERIAVLLCGNLVSDSKGIHDYYKSNRGVDSTIIAYGADIPPKYEENNVDHILSELGIERKKYILQVTRFEPENNPLLTLQAFNALETDFKCVLIGGAIFRSSYLRKIEDEENKNEKIIFPGFIYHKDKLNIIWQNAYCYIHGNLVGGTNPALLQAMAAGRPIIAIDCRFNRDTLNGHGYFFERNVENLCNQISYILQNQDEAEEKALNALNLIKTVYTWNKVTNEYEKLFLNIVNETSLPSEVRR